MLLSISIFLCNNESMKLTKHWLIEKHKTWRLRASLLCVRGSAPHISRLYGLWETQCSRRCSKNWGWADQVWRSVGLGHQRFWMGWDGMGVGVVWRGWGWGVWLVQLAGLYGAEGASCVLFWLSCVTHFLCPLHPPGRSACSLYPSRLLPPWQKIVMQTFPKETTLQNYPEVVCLLFIKCLLVKFFSQKKCTGFLFCLLLF